MSFDQLKPYGLLALALLAGHAGISNAASSDYLAAVRADLQEFSSGEFTLPEDNPWLRKAQGASDGTASLADFETFVKSKFRGTYILFARLPEWKKTEIWQEYLSTGDLGGIRTNIYAARRSGDSRPKRSLSNLPLDF